MLCAGMDSDPPALRSVRFYRIGLTAGPSINVHQLASKKAFKQRFQIGNVKAPLRGCPVR